MEIQSEIIEILKECRMTVTTVESCTGGMIAAALTDVPGSSEVFRRGFVTYCDEAKHEMVGVRQETLEKYTAVSAQTAAEMAEGGARAARADCCLSATGYAGSDMGDGNGACEAAAEEPVGLVYVGCWFLGETEVRELHLTGTRAQIRAQARDEALALLKRKIERQCCR